MRQLIAMAALWAGLLVLMSLCMRSATAAPALNNSSGQPGAFPACAELAVQGLVRFPIGRVCAWPKQPPSARQDHIQLLGEASGTFPAVLLSAASNSTLAAPSVPGASAAGDWCQWGQQGVGAQQQPTAGPQQGETFLHAHDSCASGASGIGLAAGPMQVSAHCRVLHTRSQHMRTYKL